MPLWYTAIHNAFAKACLIISGREHEAITHPPHTPFRPRYLDVVCKLSCTSPTSNIPRPAFGATRHDLWTIPFMSSSVHANVTGTQAHPCICLLTDEYLCLIELRPMDSSTSAPAATAAAHAVTDTRAYLNVQSVEEATALLRVRTCIQLNALQSVELSPNADDVCVLHITPAQPPTNEDHSHWLEDSAAPACEITQTPFGLFTRRHHWCVCAQC